MEEKFFTTNVIMGPEGKPVFVGKDEEVVAKKSEGSKIDCPICGQPVDYLVGDDTPDGGRRGCESCWKPSTGKKQHEPESKQEEVISY